MAMRLQHFTQFQKRPSHFFKQLCDTSNGFHWYATRGNVLLRTHAHLALNLYLNYPVKNAISAVYNVSMTMSEMLPTD